MEQDKIATPYPRIGAISWLVILALLAAITVLEAGRHYPTFGTETDFFGGFVNQSRMITEGQPLHLGYHPPLYPVLIAGLHSLWGNWFRDGLLLSWLSAVLVLVAQFRFFATILDEAAGLGALLALGTSTVFLSYAGLASSDVFFLALWSLALWLAALAWDSPRNAPWVACGVAVGLGILTRTNGITLLALSVLPWIAAATGAPPALRRFTAWSLGLVLPLAIWAAVALATGSDLLPHSNYGNLGMTYFGSGDRISGESRIAIEASFDGVLDVLRHDPVQIAVHYARDLLRLPGRLVRDAAIALPVALLALLGLPFAARRLLQRRVLAFVAVTLVQVLMVNLKTYEARVYLVLVPWAGAVAGAGLHALLRCSRFLPEKAGAMAVLVATLLLSGLVAFPAAIRFDHRDDAELGWLIGTVNTDLPAGAVLVSRKPHLAYFTDVTKVGFPDVATLDALRESLAGYRQETVYVYYGSVERWARPALAALSDPQTAPDWMVPVAVHPDARGWVLYRAVP